MRPPRTQDDGVLLKRVSFTGNIGGNFNAGSESNARHFAQCRVRLLRRRRENTRANTATLWAAFKRWSVCLFQRFASALSDQLANCRQSLFSPFIAHK